MLEHYSSIKSLWILRYVDAKGQEMIEWLWRSGSYWPKVAFEDGKAFSRWPLLICWCIPELLAGSSWGMGKGLMGQRRVQGSAKCLEVLAPSLRDLTSFLSECWEGCEASQVLCPSSCIVRRNVRLPHLEEPSLAAENPATLAKGGRGAQRDLFSWSSLNPSAKPLHSPWWFLVASPDMAPARTWWLCSKT